MATMRDFEIIEVISRQKRKAKERGMDVSVSLSGGREYYRRAINSMRISGIWTIWATVWAYAVILTLNIIGDIRMMSSGEYNIDWFSYMAGKFLALLPFVIINIVFACKIRSLSATPTTTLVFLVFTMILNLLLFIGVLPLVSVVLNIIALTRWSTYKDWFYKIDPKRSR